MKEQTITAKTLLLMFLELQKLLNLNQWQEESIDNPPRLLRLQQLKAMFRTFEIPFNPQLFVSGEFIDGDSPRYDPIFKQLMLEVPNIEFFVGRKKHGRDQLSNFFPPCIVIEETWMTCYLLVVGYLRQATSYICMLVAKLPN